FHRNSPGDSTNATTKIQVFIDSTYFNQYIPITAGSVKTWALALKYGAVGVSVNSPPASLKYVNLSSKKQKIKQPFDKNNFEPSDGGLSSGKESRFINQGHVRKWGLSDRVISQLRDTIQNYEKKLRKTKM
ncbi:uncharacterized protein VP01_2242g1, partial [Puccinia sorghi]